MYPQRQFASGNVDVFRRDKTIYIFQARTRSIAHHPADLPQRQKIASLIDVGGVLSSSRRERKILAKRLPDYPVDCYSRDYFKDCRAKVKGDFTRNCGFAAHALAGCSFSTYLNTRARAHQTQLALAFFNNGAKESPESESAAERISRARQSELVSPEWTAVAQTTNSWQRAPRLQTNELALHTQAREIRSLAGRVETNNLVYAYSRIRESN